jgi:hypothetical protein
MTLSAHTGWTTGNHPGRRFPPYPQSRLRRSIRTRITTPKLSRMIRSKPSPFTLADLSAVKRKYTSQRWARFPALLIPLTGGWVLRGRLTALHPCKDLQSLNCKSLQRLYSLPENVRFRDGRRHCLRTYSPRHPRVRANAGTCRSYQRIRAVRHGSARSDSRPPCGSR